MLFPGRALVEAVVAPSWLLLLADQQVDQVSLAEQLHQALAFQNWSQAQKPLRPLT